MEIALFQPDIPQNLGGSLRLAACFSVPAHIIEPCGFIFDDKRMKRAGMDYIDQANYHRHTSWEAFCAWKSTKTPKPRLVLLTTKGSATLPDFTFQPNDILLVGRESSGVPEEVVNNVDARVRIPLAADARSLNVTVSLGIALSEALRQTHQYPNY